MDFTKDRAEYRLLWRYSLSLTQYNELLESQNGHCALCPSQANLVVDHDHNCCPSHKSCGKCIRGILCYSCNTALGKFKENPDILFKAFNYVNKSKN